MIDIIIHKKDVGVKNCGRMMIVHTPVETNNIVLATLSVTTFPTIAP